MPHHTAPGSEVTRRAVVAGTGVLAASATIAACSSYRSSTTPPPQAPGAPAGAVGRSLASTADIPVGGGMVFTSAEVVVTQPSPGTFKAFTAICTHAGCSVKEVVSGTINCPCHGSRYAIADGSVVNGPASRPLAEREITISGDAIQLS
ncbi:MAG: Rieske (2Fe-2S) protein [Pseudonocardiaceae bacterium]